MVSLRFILVFLGSINSLTSVWASDPLPTDKENIPPSPRASGLTPAKRASENNALSLEENLRGIQLLITEGHERGNCWKIYEAEKKFQDIKGTPNDWETLATSWNAFKWPQQKEWRQVVAGHLFYPSNTQELLASQYTEHLIQRSDMIWAYAAAAKYHHSLGKYYTAYALEKARSLYIRDPERPEWCDRFYKEALSEFENSLTHPEARYVLAINYEHESIYVGILDYEFDKAVELHRQGSDSLNQLGVLDLQKINHQKDPSPEAFLELARRTKYGPAYIEAFQRTADREQKRAIAEEALALPYGPAAMKLAHALDKADDRRLHYYKIAATHGLASGELYQGLRALGKCPLHSPKLSSLSQQTLEQIETHFNKAGEMLDPEGWEYLAKLYTQMHTLKLFQSEEEESTLIDKITDAWKKGIQLGWSASYTGMLTHLKKHYKNPDKSFENIVEDFGPSPCAGLPELLEKFIAGKA